MAEDGTQLDGTRAPDNPSSVDPTETPKETTPAEPSPLWKELGYESAEALKTGVERLKTQNHGAAAEVNRWRTEAEKTRQDHAALQGRFDAFQTVLAGSQSAGQQARDSGHFSENLDAWLRGDADAATHLNTLFQRMTTKIDELEEKANPEKLLATWTAQVNQAVRPKQLESALVQRYPDLGNNQSPLYKAVWSRLGEITNDPEYATMFGPDPAAVLQVTGPDGYETRPVDLRLARMLAAEETAKLARQQGANEEATRKNAPTVEPSGGRPAVATERDPWEQLTPQERESVDVVIQRGVVPAHWPQVADPAKARKAIAKYIVDRRKKRAEVA